MLQLASGTARRPLGSTLGVLGLDVLAALNAGGELLCSAEAVQAASTLPLGLNRMGCPVCG